MILLSQSPMSLFYILVVCWPRVSRVALCCLAVVSYSGHRGPCPPRVGAELSGHQLQHPWGHV